MDVKLLLPSWPHWVLQGLVDPGWQNKPITHGAREGQPLPLTGGEGAQNDAGGGRTTGGVLWEPQAQPACRQKPGSTGFRPPPVSLLPNLAGCAQGRIGSAHQHPCSQAWALTEWPRKELYCLSFHLCPHLDATSDSRIWRGCRAAPKELNRDRQ